jgi:glycosyltransferase involved in cell wall biosynthesis
LKVSVLMSVYNGSTYLQESIDSILNQTFSDFEFVIIDDCSTDDTWSILTQNAERDQRIILIKNDQNLGLTKSLNKGLNIVKNDFVARQDADDISLPQRLEREVSVLTQIPNCVMVSCHIQVILGGNKKVVEVMDRSCSPEQASWYLLFYNRIGGHSQVMYRRNIVLELGGYSEAWPYTEDYELWCRLSRTKRKIIILPEVLLTYRRHNQSISAQKSNEQQTNCNRLVQLNIAHLIGEDITSEEAVMLMNFWKSTLKIPSGDAHQRFPSSRSATLIHHKLTEIKRCFVREYELAFGAGLDHQIQAVISRQFLVWLQSPLTSKHTIWSKIQISRYAFLWNPVNVLRGWVIWIFRFPFDTATSIYNKLQQFVRTRRSQSIESESSS